MTVPSINPWSSFAVKDKITADSTVGLAVYSRSVFMQFSKYRFLFLHYFQMNCTTGKYVDPHVFSSNIHASLMSFYNQVSLVYKRCFLRCFSVWRLSGWSVLMAEMMQKYKLCFQNSASFIQLRNILVCMGFVGCLKAYRHLWACWHRLGYILLENSATYCENKWTACLKQCLSW